MHDSVRTTSQPLLSRQAVRFMTMLALLCLWSAVIGQVPMTSGTEFIVTVEALNVRNRPGTDGTEVIGKVALGDRGTVVNATPHWADGFWWWQARFGNDMTGWVAEGYSDEPLIAVYDPAAPVPVTDNPVNSSGVRAWQTIEFGESRSAVAAKVSFLYTSGTVQADSALAASLLLNLSSNVAGVPTKLYFVFDDDRLHEVWFQSRTRERTAAELDYNVLRDVQIAAHGQPNITRRLSSLRPERSFIEFGDLWRRGEVLYRLGLGRPDDGSFRDYHAVLIVEWEALSQEIIRDAADGF